MKILLAGQAFYQHNNGQAVFTINLAEGLAQAGHAVMVLAPAEHGRPYRKVQQGVTLQTLLTVPVKYNANITLFSDRLVAQSMAAFAPEIVHIQDHYFLSRSVLRCARHYPVKLVGTNHFLPNNLIDNLWLPLWLRRPMEQWLWHTMLAVYTQLDGVTTPTATGVSILKEVGLGVPLQAISCGVDSWRFRPRPTLDRVAMRRKYGLGVDATLLLFVGRVDHEKCLDLVIKALAILQRPDLQLVIAGTGSHQAALSLLVQELGLADRVVFTGFVPDRDLPLLLNSVDAFVMPSHAELQSIATLEAMASGLPVVAANARALPELVTDDVNGYLFTPNDAAAAADAIAKLLDNRARWATMRMASLDKVKTHTANRTIQRYLDWYQQVQPASHAGRTAQPAAQWLPIHQRPWLAQTAWRWRSLGRAGWAAKPGATPWHQQ